MKFFTSDLHHKHKNICKYTSRNKETLTEEHDQWLINIWNDAVLPSDVVYHIGDLSFSTKYDQVAEFVSALKGQKFLIKGNHDRTEFLDQLKADNLIQNWYDYKEIKIGDNKVILFHFPISAWHQQHRNSFHLHGHSHGSHVQSGKILDVGIDSSYNISGTHTLFSENAVLEYMQGRNTVVSDHHTCREGE